MNWEKTFVHLHLYNPYGSKSTQGLFGTYGMGRAIKIDTYPEPVPEGFPIQPHDINSEHWKPNLGWMELEHLLAKLLAFARTQKSWKPFTSTDLVNAGIKIQGNLLDLFGYSGYVRTNEDGSYQFTVGFVLECVLASLPHRCQPENSYPYPSGSGQYVLADPPPQPEKG